jgi:hypothetical protein
MELVRLDVPGRAGAARAGEADAVAHRAPSPCAARRDRRPRRRPAVGRPMGKQ